MQSNRFGMGKKTLGISTSTAPTHPVAADEHAKQTLITR